jgi:hypothetical protein
MLQLVSKWKLQAGKKQEKEDVAQVLKATTLWLCKQSCPGHPLDMEEKT